MIPRSCRCCNVFVPESQTFWHRMIPCVSTLSVWTKIRPAVMPTGLCVPLNPSSAPMFWRLIVIFLCQTSWNVLLLNISITKYGAVRHNPTQKRGHLTSACNRTRHYLSCRTAKTMVSCRTVWKKQSAQAIQTRLFASVCLHFSQLTFVRASRLALWNHIFQFLSIQWVNWEQRGFLRYSLGREKDTTLSWRGQIQDGKDMMY
jgi:hypothetical protein